MDVPRKNTGAPRSIRTHPKLASFAIVLALAAGIKARVDHAMATYDPRPIGFEEQTTASRGLPDVLRELEEKRMPWKTLADMTRAGDVVVLFPDFSAAHKKGQSVSELNGLGIGDGILSAAVRFLNHESLPLLHTTMIVKERSSLDRDIEAVRTVSAGYSPERVWRKLSWPGGLTGKMIEDSAYGAIALRLPISESMRQKVVAEMQKLTGKPYDWTALSYLFLNRFFGTSAFRKSDDGEYFCYEMLFTALREAGAIPNDSPVQALTPLDLIASGKVEILGMS